MMLAIGKHVSNFFFPKQTRSIINNRDRWNSRLAFVFACIGSAVGFGNLWRFPALTYKFGGGPFLLTYILAFFIVGIPLLTLEFSIGQTFQSGDIVSFGLIHRRLGGIGLASIIAAFIVVCYYTIIIAWSVLYFIASFQSPLPWNAASSEESLSGANDFFFRNVLDAAVSHEGISIFRPYVFVAALFTWIVIFLCIFRGVSFTGNIVFISTPLPVLLILIMMIRGATLDGAGIGIKAYIGTWDWSSLSDGTIWSEAVSQIFFSIGICFGVMTAYASYNRTRSNCVRDALVVCFSNSGISILCGFAVFSILGHFSVTSGIDINDLDVGGIKLTFLTYPVALSRLPWPQGWCVLFFGTLFFLGIDSAFSMVEAVTTAVKDAPRFRHLSHGKVTVFISGFALAVSTVFATDAGLNLVDVIDYYVNNFLLVFVGFMESIAAGWVYDVEQQSAQLGRFSVLLYAASWFIGSIVACIISFSSAISVAIGARAAALGIPIGVMIILTGSIFSYIYSEQPAEKSVAYWLFFHNPEALRVDLNSVIAPSGSNNTEIPVIWGFLMKYIISPLLLVLLAININSISSNRGYQDYSVGYQVTGMLFAVLPLLLSIAAMAIPKIMDGLIFSETEAEIVSMQMGNLSNVDNMFNKEYSPSIRSKESAPDIAPA